MWLVDSNVLVDVLHNDPIWYAWSADALAMSFHEGGAVVNPVVYAEIAAGFLNVETMEADLASLRVGFVEIPKAALFLAGHQFRAYRARSGSPRTSLLPDFLIGAHAAVLGVPLVTRDTRRFRAYFPTVHLVTPATFG